MKQIIYFILLIILATSVLAAVPEGLHYYSFDVDENDEIGSNDFTLFNGAAITGTGCLLGSCLEIDGTNDYAQFLNNLQNFTDGDFTVNIWVNSAVVYDPGTEIYPRVIATRDFQLVVQRDNTLAGNVFSTPDSLSGGARAIKQNAWSMATYTYNRSGDGIRVYINGSLESDAGLLDGFGEVINTNSMLGSRNDINPVTFFNGKFDELYIVKEQLTPEAILELWNDGNGFNPLVTLDMDFVNESPVNDTNINSSTLFFYNVTVASVAPNCTLFADAVELETQELTVDGRYNFSVNIASLSAGYNDMNLTCADGVTTLSENKFIFVDKIDPVIDFINFVQPSDNLNFEFNGSEVDENIILNISCTDTNLFSMNVTIWTGTNIDYNNYTENIGVGAFILDDIVNIGTLHEDLMNITVSCADAHTLRNIPNIPNWAIENGHQYDHVGITTNSAYYDSFAWTKQDDRYNFTFYFSGYGNDVTFFIGSTKKLNRVDDFLVTGEYWIDFINYDGWEIVNFNRINNKIVRIDLHNDDAMNYVSFHSIGIINTVTETVEFTVNVDTDNVTTTTPLNGTLFLNNGTIATSLVAFNYTPWYAPSPPNNCSIFVNNTVKGFDDTISKNVNNIFNVNLSFPPPQTNESQTWYVTCNQEHFHAPSTFENRIKTSGIINITLHNFAVTTTTSTSTTTTAATTTTIPINATAPQTGGEFESVPQALTLMFLTGIWIFFIWAAFSIKGKAGNTPQIFALMVVLWGVFLGIRFFALSTMLGIIITLLSAIIGLGKMSE